MNGHVSRLLFIAGFVTMLSPCFSQEFWQPTSGPYGGKVTSLAASGSARFLAGTWGGGAYIADGAAGAWRRPSIWPGNSTVRSLIALPNGVVIAGTGGSGTYRSLDSGDTWQKADTVMKSQHIAALAYKPPSTIFAGTSQGVYSSTDNGITWAQRGHAGEWINAVAVTPGGHVLAATNGGEVFESTDDGVSWDQLYTSSDPAYAIAVKGDNDYFVGFWNRGVIRIEGGTATSFTAGVGTVTVNALVLRSDGTLFAATDFGVYQSPAVSASWTARGLSAHIVTVLHLMPNDLLYAGTSGGGCFHSPALWARHTEGMDNMTVLRLGSTESDLLYAGTAGGVFKTTNRGGTWMACENGILKAQIDDLAVHRDGVVYAATSAGIFHTSDAGATWRRCITAPQDTAVRAVMVDAAGNVLAGTDNHVYLSTDEGYTWEMRESGITTQGTHIMHASRNGDVFLAVSNHVYRSTDLGMSWWDISSTGWTAYISAIRTNDSGHVFVVGRTAGVSRSTDHGASWSIVGIGLPLVEYRSVFVAPNGHVFAGSAAGFAYRSTDNGSTWTSAISGMRPFAVNDFAIDTSGYLYAGLSGAIVLRSANTVFNTAPQTAPVLTSPADNAGAVPTPVLLQWNTVPAATSYRIMLAHSADFASPVLDTATIPTACIATTLGVATRYYWRVQARNAEGAGPWSQVWNFSTCPLPPAPPALASPPDEAVSVARPPTLQWSAASGADSYRLQVSTDTSFAAPVLDQSDLSGTQQSVGNLKANTRYRWRVNSRNACGSSAWSAARSFTTAADTLPFPILLAPPDGALEAGPSVTFRWNSVPGALDYRIAVSADTLFGASILDESGVAATQFTSAALPTGTDLFWRVKARGSAGESVWSASWRFRMALPLPGTPVLIAPADGAAGVSLPAVLRWMSAAAAESYRVQLSTAADFSAIVQDTSGCIDTTHAALTLQGSTTYYWRVNATNATGTSPWSEVRQFATAALPPDAPILSSPLNGISSVPTTLYLGWQAATGAQRYRVQLALEQSFNTPVLDSTTETTLMFVGPLNGLTTYYWRVAAENAAGTSSWSDTWSFSTMATTGAHNPTVVPGSVAVLTVSPNPSAERVNVAYALPDRCVVRIRVFSMLGTELEALDRGMNEPGRHSASIGTAGLPPGLYLLAVEAAGQSAVAPFAIVR